jgi:hypothetical protein
MARKFALLASLAAFAMASTPLAAQQDPNLCGKRQEIVDKLSQQFKEKSMAVGLVDQNAVVEIFVSNDGTWTILATGTDGNSCVVSAGEGWQSQAMVTGEDA